MIKALFMLLSIGLMFQTAQAAPLHIDETTIKTGRYYVGPVFGQQPYADHANTSLAAYNIMTTTVTYRFYHDLLAWAADQGYLIEGGCNGARFEDCLPPEQDGGKHPVTNISWWDAIVFANALSARQGLTPYYLAADGQPLKQQPEPDAEQVIHTDPHASGYRLPSRNEMNGKWRPEAVLQAWRTKATAFIMRAVTHPMPSHISPLRMPPRSVPTQSHQNTLMLSGCMT